MSKYRWNPVVNVGCLVSNEQNAQTSVDPDDLGYVIASWVRCSDPLLLREEGPSVEVRTGESTTYCRVESGEKGKSLGPRALWRTVECTNSWI